MSQMYPVPPAHASQHTSAHSAALHSAEHTPSHGTAGESGGVVPGPLRVVVADDNPVVRAGLTALLEGREDIHVVAEASDGRQAYEAARRHRPDVVLLDVRMPGADGLAALPLLVPLAPVLMLTYSRERETVHECLRLGAGGYLVHGEFTADQLAASVHDIRAGRAPFTPTATHALATPRPPSPNPPNPPQLPYGSSPPEADVAQSAFRQRRWATGARAALGRGPDPGTGPARGRGRPRERYGLSGREAEVMGLIASGMTNAQIAATCFISEKTVKNHINRIFTKLSATSRSEAIALWLGTAPGPGPGHGASPHA
ncbi:response regulator transcription factor [Streptomyces daliensis]